MQKQTIKDVEVSNKRVFVRCDFNVPLDERGNITDDKRIKSSISTIKYLMENDSKIILCSHLGRPKGFDSKFSMKPVAERLGELLDKHIVLSNDVIGEDAKNKAAQLEKSDILLLENVRFHSQEKKNDEDFSKQLANLADLYVNNAFGTAHRAHSSTVGITNYLPSVAGFLIQKEIEVMGKAISNPERPFMAILGGSKVSDKIGVIDNLLEKVDTLAIAGGMAYTFLQVQGFNMGNSMVEQEKLELTKDLLKKAEDKGVKLLLPLDHLAAKEFKADAQPITINEQSIPDDLQALDIGPKTIDIFKNHIQDAKTVIWNGPVGVFEFDNFSNGTYEVAKTVAETDASTIIGGGDSAAAVEKFEFADKVTHVSTGGGASLEYLEGKELPGIVALNDK